MGHERKQLKGRSEKKESKAKYTGIITIGRYTIKHNKSNPIRYEGIKVNNCKNWRCNLVLCQTSTEDKRSVKTGKY